MADLKEGQLAVSLGGSCQIGTVLHCDGVHVVPIGKTNGHRYTLPHNTNRVRLLKAGETIIVG
jgi:hypothetical protein